MTVIDFYKYFLKDNADFGIDIYSRMMERRNIELEDWHPNEESIPCRLLKSVIPLKGIPFLKSTRHLKSYKLIHKDDTRIIVDIENR